MDAVPNAVAKEIFAGELNDCLEWIMQLAQSQRVESSDMLAEAMRMTIFKVKALMEGE